MLQNNYKVGCPQVWTMALNGLRGQLARLFCYLQYPSDLHLFNCWLWRHKTRLRPGQSCTLAGTAYRGKGNNDTEALLSMQIIALRAFFVLSKPQRAIELKAIQTYRRTGASRLFTHRSLREPGAPEPMQHPLEVKTSNFAQSGHEPAPPWLYDLWQSLYNPHNKTYVKITVWVIYCKKKKNEVCLYQHMIVYALYSLMDS